MKYFIISILYFSFTFTGILYSQDTIRINFETDTIRYLRYEWNYNLLLAIENGNMDHASYFIKKGADVNASTYEGLTPLFYAVLSDNYEMVSFLMSKGAKPNKVSYDGKTPLILCANDNFLEIGELLIQKGANIDVEDYKKRTALYYSAANDYFYFTDMLIQYGANLYWKDNNGMTPLMMACLYGNFDIVELLLIKGANFEDEDFEGNSPFILAVQGGNLEIVKLLWSYGIDINRLNDHGYSALSYAIYNNRPDIVAYLLENGAEPNKKYGSGNSYVKLAKTVKNNDIEKLLFEAGANYTSILSFDKINFSLGSSFSSKDIFLTSKFGVYESQFLLAFNFLFGIRPFAPDILVKERDNYYYQLSERRSYIGLSIEKEINIIKKYNQRVGINFSLEGLYSFSKYIGFDNTSNDLALISPGISLFNSKNNFYYSIGYSWNDFKTLKFPKSRFTVGLMYRFNIGNSTPLNKTVKW